MGTDDEAGGLFDFSDMEEAEEERAVSSVTVRCEQERERKPILWTPPAHRVRSAGQSTGKMYGIFYKLKFPVLEDALRDVDAKWLTAVMQAAGTLRGDNSICSVKSVRRLGNSLGGATRLWLTVAYQQMHAHLHENLLMKISTPVPSKDESPIESDSDTSQDEGLDDKTLVPFPFEPLDAFDYFTEINFHRLYEDKSPYPMPKFYYGDICSRTGNSVLITEYIALPEDSEHLQSFKYIDTCHIQATGGLYLCCHDGALGNLFTSEVAQHWTLERQDEEGTIFLFRSRDGRYLTEGKAGSSIQGLSLEDKVFCQGLNIIEEDGFELARWTLEALPGGLFRIKSSNNKYLAVASGTVSTSTNIKKDRSDVFKIEPQGQEIPRFSSKARNFDLKNMSWKQCSTMIAHGAHLAGMYKAGELGSPELVDQSFQKPVDDVKDASFGSLSNTTFLKKAAQAQEFIGRLAAAVFPRGTVNRYIMKEYRSMVAVLAANKTYMRWYFGFEVDYVALGRGRTDANSSFTNVVDCPSWSCGFCDWEGISVGPLAGKIWDWLRFADCSVLSTGALDNLLREFIEIYHRSGGPQLDFVTLRMQLVLYAAMDSIFLLDSVHEIYKACPKAEWSSLEGLNDPRILRSTTRCGSLWQCVKSFVNIVLVLKEFRVSELTNAAICSIIPWHVVLSEPLVFKLIEDCVEMRAGPSASSELLAVLPAKFVEMLPEEQFLDTLRQGGKYVYAKTPVAGWIRVTDVHDVPDGFQNEETACIGSLLSLMQNTRRQYFGDAQGMSVVAATKLFDEILHTEFYTNLLKRMRRGQPQVVHGSFLAKEERCDWWPEGYEHWAPHSFIAFEDGSIADIAAYSFDDVPHLWFPADKRRYEFDCRKADEASRIRNDVVGFEKWKSLSRTSNVKSRHDEWWLTDTGQSVLGHLQEGGPQNGQEAALGNLSNSTVFRHGAPLAIPTVSRRVTVENRSSAIGVRKLADTKGLKIELIENLFGAAIVDRLLQCCAARNGFQPSLVSTSDAKGVSGSKRTSWSCAMHWHGPTSKEYLEKWREEWNVSEEQQEKELELVREITNCCAKVLDVKMSQIEPLQLVKYTPGQFFKPHLDSHKEPERASSFNGEQRTHTLLVFLNDVPASDGGGCLHFPLLGLRFLPRKGNAVIWNNVGPNGTPDPDSLHEGEAPKKSEKFAMNVWITDRPLSQEFFTGKPRKAAAANIPAGATKMGGESLYEVVHSRVAIRKAAGIDAEIRSVAKQGVKLRGTPYEVDGNPWLLLSRKSWNQLSKYHIIDSGDNWLLMHGRSIGFGELLKPVGNKENDVGNKGSTPAEVPQVATTIDATKSNKADEKFGVAQDDVQHVANATLADDSQLHSAEAHQNGSGYFFPHYKSPSADNVSDKHESEFCAEEAQTPSEEAVHAALDDVKDIQAPCQEEAADGISRNSKTDGLAEYKQYLDQTRLTRNLGEKNEQLQRWAYNKPTVYAGMVEKMLGRT